MVHSAVRHWGILATVMAGLASTAAVQAQAIIATEGDGNRVFLMPDPEANPAAPVMIEVSGLPVGARPHGASYVSPTRALVSDFLASRILVIDTVTASLLHTITTAGLYDGTGPIAVSPDGRTVLAWGFGHQRIVVIREPYGPGAAISSVSVPDNMASFQTDAIVFAENGRAFVRGENLIHVLDPPYASVAFSMPVRTRPSTAQFRFSGALALTPDGNTLLAADLENTVDVYNAPFFQGKQHDDSIVLGLQPGAEGADGLTITRDGAYALVVNAFAPQIALISAPFGAASDVELLPMPVGLTNGCGESGTAPCPGFEDLDINRDGDLIIVTGNSLRVAGNPNAGYAPAAFIVRDGDDFTVTAVEIGDGTLAVRGRGTGTVRFIPQRIADIVFRDGFESGLADKSLSRTGESDAPARQRRSPSPAVTGTPAER
jgi:hypothetical protein